MQVKSRDNRYQKPIGNEAEKHIGKCIHLANAPSGCTWRLLSIDGDIAHLETPKTRKKRMAHRSELYSKSHYEPDSL